MTRLPPEKVFTPGKFPEFTYVDRQDAEYEVRLLRYAVADGILPSVLGPSKSGKTVLAEKVLGKRWLRVSGSEIDEPATLWHHVLRELNVPLEQSRTSSSGRETSAEVGIEAEAGLPLFAKGGANATGGLTATSNTEKSDRYVQAGMRKAVEALIADGRILVVDDFHYVPENAKRDLARQLKEALTLGLQVVVMAVPHRSDDPIRSNPDLRGRVASIDMGYWEVPSLMEIGRLGFPKVGINLDDDSIRCLAVEALRSPLLMQALCLETAYLVESAGNFDGRLSSTAIQRIASRAADLTDASTAYQMLSSGPKRHGKERTSFPLAGGGTADNYELILRAVAMDPPMSSLPYEEIRHRVASLTAGDPPPMDRITRSLGYMQDIVDEELSSDRVISWDEQKRVLDIVDPHFLFFLRWRVGRT